MVVNKILKKYWFLILVLLATFVLYSRMFQGFFQQDEWFSYGWFVLHRNLNFIDSLKFFFYPSVGHYNPFIVGIQQILFSVWGLNYTNFALLGIILHLIVVINIYFLSLKILKGDKIKALVVSFLFATLQATYQATAWVVTDIATLMASLLGFISTYLFFIFLKERKNKYLVESMMILILSLFFKEVTIGLFAVFFFTLLFQKKVPRKSIGIIVAFGVSYFLFRASMFFVPSVVGGDSGGSGQSISRILYNFLTLPLKSFFYVLIPVDLARSVSIFFAKLLPSRVTGSYGSPQFEVFVVKKLMEGLSVLVGGLIITLGIWRSLKIKNKFNKFMIYFGIVWAILNSFIFVLSPGISGIITVPDSRNLYFLSFGVCLFLIALLTKKFKWLLILFFILNFYFLNHNLINYTQMGNLRRNILQRISSDYPKLNGITIFYTESDTSYYGLPEQTKIMPFQSGFGQTLLAWYEKKENFPKGFFENGFLWNIDSQGYQEIDGRGFGYFRNFDDLKNAFYKYHLDPSSLIAYSFDSKTHELIDITNAIKKKLIYN